MSHNLNMEIFSQHIRNALYLDTLGWVIRPVKTVGRITYIVLVQMLNPAQSISVLVFLPLIKHCLSVVRMLSFMVATVS